LNAAWRRMLVRAWQRRGVLACSLWPLAQLFGAVVAAHRGLYRAGLFTAQPVPIPVVVVGNVVAGGAGKTPVVIALVQHLRQRGLRAGVVSRGYGRSSPECREVFAQDAAADVGDEPLLIARATGVPVAVAAARSEAARLLLARHPELQVLVSDDGLQHHALQRDVELCVFDQRGIGNGWLMPAGPLREAWPRPVDLVLRAGPEPAAGGNTFKVARALADHAVRMDGTRVALIALRQAQQRAGSEIHAVAGIAEPAAFFAMLREQGLRLTRAHALADHAAFDPARWTRDDAPLLLCTEKDAVKLWPLRPDALAVPLELHLEPAFWSAFDAVLDAAVARKLSSAHGYPTA